MHVRAARLPVSPLSVRLGDSFEGVRANSFGRVVRAGRSGELVQAGRARAHPGERARIKKC